MKINKDYLFTKKEIGNMKLSVMKKVTGFAIHNTYNTASALNEAKNQFNNNTKKGVNGVAVHFYVDEENIYQLLPLNINGWHASDGGTGEGNMNSIAIEICRSRDYDTNNYHKAEVLTMELIAYLVKNNNIPFKLRRHYDFDTRNRKKCPHRMFEGKNNTWDEFVAKTTAIVKGTATEKPVVKPPTTTTKTVEQMAQEVYAGKHGNGHATRQKSLGVNATVYAQVRARVNQLAGITVTQPKPIKTVEQMARECIRGDHGNGHATRQKSLGIDDRTYAKVRVRVNQLV